MRLTIDVNVIGTDWQEKDHPRGQPGNAGQFATAPTPAHGVRGLPDGAEIESAQLKEAIARGAFHPVARPGRESSKYESPRERFNLHFYPKGLKGIKLYLPSIRKDRIGFYNTNMAHLVTINEDEPILAKKVPRLKAGYSEDIEPLPQKDAIYRGMSYEEYRGFRQSGEIKSHGKYNIGSEQEGLTYWGTDPGTATSYANSFAPMQYKPTFTKPAYVVAAAKPKEVRKVEGTGSNEVGVARGIKADEVLAVWEGNVYDFDPGSYELEKTDGSYRLGSASGIDTRVAWKRIA